MLICKYSYAYTDMITDAAIVRTKYFKRCMFSHFKYVIGIAEMLQDQGYGLCFYYQASRADVLLFRIIVEDE